MRQIFTKYILDGIVFDRLELHYETYDGTVENTQDIKLE